MAAKIEHIEATYRATTPMFCGGADPKDAELRLPSFKGALRFWWRALAWSRLGGDLEAIEEEEAELFGSTKSQAKVSMRLDAQQKPETIATGDVLKILPNSPKTVGDGARYLGYGVMQAFGANAGKLSRSCLIAPFEFTVRLRCRDLDFPALSTLKASLIALGIFGGMGAKSRKGYGSLMLQSLCVNGEEVWQTPQSMKELCNRIESLRHDSGLDTTSLPEYTALTGNTRHVLLTTDKRESLETLDLIGREMVRYRSWGHKGNILGNIPSERNFEDDHDLMKLPPAERKSHPRRIAFGLPHNYGRKSDDQVSPWDKRNLDRRASPLFIHIHECGETPVAVLSFLPARFLPRGNSDIRVGCNRVSQAPEPDLYQPIHEFLDRLKRARNGLDVVEVRP